MNMRKITQQLANISKYYILIFTHKLTRKQRMNQYFHYLLDCYYIVVCLRAKNLRVSAESADLRMSSAGVEAFEWPQQKVHYWSKTNTG